MMSRHTPHRISADILSGDAWLLDDEPPHPTPDYSILSIPPTLGGDSERPGADQAPGKAEYVLPPMTSVLPNYGKGREEEVGGEPPLPRNALGSLLQRELPAGAETVDSGPSPDTADATKESLQELTAEAPTSPKAGMASTPEGAVDHYSAPSSRTSASPRQLPAGVRLSQESQSVEQSSSMIDLPTDATVISRFAWLSEFLPAVPIDVMRTHPFYRHPQHQEERLIRQSSAPFAALFRPIKRNAGPALAMCYTLMKLRPWTLWERFFLFWTRSIVQQKY
ncbi:LOW QUALITY PROTEIN: uncharacterized protein EMH_0043080 [Eimeria mitis]|uniref:Uncharacterized protein n=1 Tax=Eimeria mitis TaxID=44415 RepID=U6JV80_9EIME|nr:LOW QUALITY PROTEIN: uncharacterized protein EMH_0043080 [Eimeria mitis]CDJ28691.1 hypothetical protein EMH_0043080 [Eimeria mitis]